MTTTTEIPHHPHFISATPDGDRVRYEFTPFDGTEDQPAYDHDLVAEFGEDARHAYSDEIGAAYRLWRTARFRTEFAAAAADPKGPERWDAYQQAMSAVDAEFARLKDADGNRWRARIAALLDAHDAAATAAEQWDLFGSGLARLHHDYLGNIGANHKRQALPWYEVLQTLPDGWKVGGYNSEHFHYYAPAAEKLRDTVRSQRRRICEIAALAAGQDTESR